jgi:hypothetical protein
VNDTIDDWLREEAGTRADPGAVLDGLFRPGRSNLFTGEREAGKSHMTVGFHQLQIYRHPASILMTNLIFNQVSDVREDETKPSGYRAEWRPRVYPEQVIHVASLEEVFRLTGQILEKKNDWREDDDFCIYQVKDEAQNFIMADRSYEPLVQAYYTYDGILRKFRHCDSLLSPSQYNIPKRLRRFVDDISYAGYLSAHFWKEKYLVEDFNRCWGTRIDRKYFAAVKMGFDHKEELVEVPTLTWNKPEHLLEVGDIVYDHMSSAAFRLSEKPTDKPEEQFQFLKFINAISGVSSVEVPNAINSFFEHQDAEDDYDQGVDPNYEMCLRVREMLRLKERRGIKLTWADVARIEGKKESTVRMAYKKYAPQLDLDLVEMENIKEETRCKT